MADIMLVKGSTMTAMADKIRSLTGTTGALTTDQMQGELTTAKTNVDETKELIREMTGVTGELSLEQMKAQVEASNAEVETQAALIAEISDILATKAGGSGGGSAAVETCTVTLTDQPFEKIAYMSPTGRFSGEIDSSVTEIKVVKRSFLYGYYPDSTFLTLTGSVSEIHSVGHECYLLAIDGDGDIAVMW